MHKDILIKTLTESLLDIYKDTGYRHNYRERYIEWMDALHDSQLSPNDLIAAVPANDRSKRRHVGNEMVSAITEALNDERPSFLDRHVAILLDFAKGYDNALSDVATNLIFSRDNTMLIHLLQRLFALQRPIDDFLEHLRQCFTQNFTEAVINSSEVDEAAAQQLINLLFDQPYLSTQFAKQLLYITISNLFHNTYYAAAHPEPKPQHLDTQWFVRQLDQAFGFIHSMIAAPSTSECAAVLASVLNEKRLNQQYKDLKQVSSDYIRPVTLLSGAAADRPARQLQPLRHDPAGQVLAL